MIQYEYVNERGRELCNLIERNIGDYNGNATVFVGALGICVRKILPTLCDKHTDPAVVCVDSLGQWVIPVVGGHVGGANELAHRISRILGAQCVITTQSDGLELWPLDTLATTYGWGMPHITGAEMNHFIAKFVDYQPTALVLEWRDEGTLFMERTCPRHVTLFRSLDDYEEYERSNPDAFCLLIIVSPRLREAKGVRTLHYCPRCLHLGVGCQKPHEDTSVALRSADEIMRRIEEKGWAKEAISSINTIPIKEKDPLIRAIAESLPWAKLCIHSTRELAPIPVPNPSARVGKEVGAASVAEASAIAGEEGAKNGSYHNELVVEKQKGACEGFHFTFALSLEECGGGHVEIVGAGPGDADLVSVKGRQFLQQADLILYAGSLVPVELTDCAKKGCVVRSSASMSLDEQLELMHSFVKRGLLVVRLHTGDPCIYGAIEEQMAYFDAHVISYHITPGISSFQVAAAELRSQFTIPNDCQTIILTRGEGRTKVPEREKLQKLAQHQSTMCIFLSATLVRDVQRQLLEGGYAKDTPIAVCHRLTWKDQQIFRGKLCELSNIVEANNLTLQTMIVVGRAIDNRKGTSSLYDKGFSHLYRKGK